MLTIKTQGEQSEFLSEPVMKFILNYMKEDSPKFFEEINGKENEWISRVILFDGLSFPDSKIPYGFMLRYQFQKLDIGYDMGIREIVVPESQDEALDLFNEIMKSGKIFNKVYTGK